MDHKQRNLTLLYGFSFLKNLQFFGAVSVPFYLYRLEMDYLRMFTLEAIFSAAMMILEIPTGIVADRWGRKVSIILGSLSMGLGFLMFGIFRSFEILVLAEVIIAAGLTLVSGADRALVYEAAGEVRKTDQADIIFARYDAAGTAGLLISFPLGTLFVDSGWVPYRTALGLVFVFTSLGFALGALIALPVKEKTRIPREGSFMKQGLDGLLFVFKKPQLRSFGMNYAVISALTFFMFWFYQSLLLENNIAISWFGFVASAFNGIAMILLSAAGPIRKKLGIGKTLFLSSLIPGLLYFFSGVLSGIPMALAAIFGVTSFRLFRSPFLSALMNEHIEDANRATVLSGISMVERVLIALLYPIVGRLTDMSLQGTLLFLGILTSACAVLLRVKETNLEKTSEA